MSGALLAHLTRLGDPIAVIVPGALLGSVIFLALREPPVSLRDLMQHHSHEES